MQAPRQAFSSDFVYLLHAAVQHPAEPQEVVDDESEDDESEDAVEDDDGGLKEIDFDD